MAYVPGPVPADAFPWLVRELQAISQADRASTPAVYLQALAVAPDKPRDGMVVYANGTNWNPGSGAGVYVRKGAVWVLLG
jgi:hypothetical protein